MSIVWRSPDSQWDPESFNCATGLKRCLDDPKFVYLLCLFKMIFIFVDILFNVLQCKTTSNIFQNQIKSTILNIQKLREENTIIDCINKSKELNEKLVFNEFDKSNFQRLSFEIFDSLVVQLETRFEDLPKLQFIELVNEKLYPQYSTQFPKMKLIQLTEQYPFFSSEKLDGELANVYGDTEKHLLPSLLLRYLVDNSLDDVYAETSKLLRLMLTLPVTTSSSELSMSTLKRIKTY